MSDPAHRRGGWPQRTLGAALLLLLGWQALRILLIPAPTLRIGDGHWLQPQFDDPACAATRLLAMSHYDDKWSLHPDDGAATRRCVSAPVTVGDWPWVLVRYAGDPDHEAVRLGLDADGDGSMDLRWQLSGAARQGWRVAVVPLAEPFREQPVRLVIEDASAEPGAWLTVRDLTGFAGSAQGLAGPPPWPQWLAALTASALTALTLWCGWRGPRAVALAGILALVAVEFLQVSAFYLRDDYTLVGTWADGIAIPELIAYYDQFAPLYLAFSAAAVALAGAWYAPLQLLALAAHAGVVVALWRLLVRHGFANGLALAVSLLYATAWSHIDVVPWFMEICFIGYTALTLVALERTAARTAVAATPLWPAVLAAAMSPLVFAGGVVTPWLCLAYTVLFAPRDRAALRAFLGTGVVAVAVVLAGSSALGTARQVAGSASPAEMLRFVADGALASSLASLLALRGAAWVAVGLLAVAGAVALAFSGVRRTPGRWLRNIAFGATWLVAAYALQAVVRTNTGYGEAMSFRYTYFGMSGAAFALAAWLAPWTSAWSAPAERLRRALAMAAIGGVVLAAASNTWFFHERSNRVEREHFDINRQYFALTEAALAHAATTGQTAPDGLVPKTLYPGNQVAAPVELTARYRAVVCYLGDCAAGGPADASAHERVRAIWAALLRP